MGKAKVNATLVITIIQVMSFRIRMCVVVKEIHSIHTQLEGKEEPGNSVHGVLNVSGMDVLRMTILELCIPGAPCHSWKDKWGDEQRRGRKYGEI